MIYLCSTQDKMPQTKAPQDRKLPIRLPTEPLRSRRIRSPSFKHGFRMSFSTKWGPVEASVEEVSIQGARCLVPARIGNGTDEIEQGAILDDVVLTYFGQELYRGSCEARHVEKTDNGLSVGFFLSSQIVDMHALHRTAFRLAFRQRWQKVLRGANAPLEVSLPANIPSHVRTDFARWVVQSQMFLKRTREFLDEEETLAQKEDLVTRDEQLADIIAEARLDLVPLMIEFSESLTARTKEFSRDEHNIHATFFRSQLGELFFECPFTRRAFEKPLGYAGDYELMNMLYRKEPEGRTAFGKILNIHSREEPAGRATFNRLAYMGHILQNYLESAKPERAAVASVGCGAAREVNELLTRAPELGSHLDLALVDQDARALQHCERTLGPLGRATGARFQFINDPIQQLIKAENLRSVLGSRKLIYSVGLFDYLDDDVFVALIRVLYDALDPGGLLVIGNMASHNPTQRWMEYAMDWFLIHRSPDDLRYLALKVTKSADNVKIDSEPTGVNLFLHMSK
jgi:extracellular factor (EF) 3-hydroxypalmitic acid methyl ester biosynthesis protein